MKINCFFTFFYNFKLVIFFLLATMHLNCTTHMLHHGTLRYAKKAPISKGNYKIGYFEPRDTSYDPFFIDNFRDMIKFELFRAGYTSSLVSKNEYQSIMNGKIKQNEFNKSSTSAIKSISDFENLQNTAGEDLFDPVSPEIRLLTHEEVLLLKKSQNFDYFIQGSIAINDNRKFINQKQNSLIFLEIFDNNGNLAASINYSLEDKLLTDSYSLKKICESVVSEIDNNKEAKATQKSKFQWKNFWRKK